MNCLWVSGDVPYPPTYGKFVYSAGLTEALAAHSVDVVGVGLVPEDGGPVFETGVAWHAVAAARRSRAASLPSPLPSMAFGTTVLRNAVVAQFARRRWDAVVVDHLETGWVVDVVPRPGPPIVYVAHNHETSVRADVARETTLGFGRRLALRMESVKIERLERKVLSRADLLVAITDTDAARFARDAPSLSRLVLTPGYDGAPAPARVIDAATPRRVAIVTSLDWHVKQANLEAFVAVADPILAAAGVELVVAGHAPDGFVRRIEQSTRATRMLGRVDALDVLLAGTRMGIVAEPLGGGFKLKVLDYVYNRVPIASVAGSIEGMPFRDGTDHLVFPDAAALARGVVDVIDDDECLNGLQRRAFDQCGGAYTWAERGRRLADSLAALRPRPRE